MITSRQDSTKQENNPSDITKPSSSSTSSWSRLRDPRIVRVSRAFGGKDRHSKVCTVRGLRDRRVRLSVPTAIQLYDLQDRLGLSQPSKVVDWLLNAAKHEIDELPPLQIPPGAFVNNPSFLSSLNSHEGLRERRSQETSERNEEGRQFDLDANPSSLSALINGSGPSYNPFVRWEPSDLTLSNPQRCLGLSTHQSEDWHNLGLIPSHQVLVYQPGMTTQTYFPSHIGGSSNAEVDQKQLHFPQMAPVNGDSQPVAK